MATVCVAVCKRGRKDIEVAIPLDKYPSIVEIITGNTSK